MNHIPNLNDYINRTVVELSPKLTNVSHHFLRLIIIDLIDRTLNACYKDKQQNKSVITKTLTMDISECCVECSMVYISHLDKITNIKFKLILGSSEYKE